VQGGFPRFPEPFVVQGVWKQFFKSYFLRLQDDYTFSPTFLNHFNLGFTRYDVANMNFTEGFDPTTLGIPANATQDAAFPRVDFPGYGDPVTSGDPRAYENIGSTFFTDRIRDRLGIDFTRSNVLAVHDGALTGTMVDQPWGDICDGEEKRRMMLACAERIGATPAQCIAVGDGANDLPMLKAAGLGVAFHAKPAVAAEVAARIDHGDLTALLYLQGYRRSDFVERTDP
jgi:hypothetical protein